MTVLYGLGSAAADPCTDTILDFIAGGWKDVAGKKHLMESGGNYNAVIGSVNASDDLSRYRLDSIYKLQQTLVDNGQPSGAIGRYQIVRNTLQSLAEQGKIPPFTGFSREFQDKLGWTLLCRRGYRAWWRGALTTGTREAFMHQLSCEWASLPDPFNNGRSHYDGLAGNHAGCSLDQFDAMLTLAYSRRGG